MHRDDGFFDWDEDDFTLEPNPGLTVRQFAKLEQKARAQCRDEGHDDPTVDKLVDLLLKLAPVILASGVLANPRQP